jgi:hypothetical protein
LSPYYGGEYFKRGLQLVFHLQGTAGRRHQLNPILGLIKRELPGSTQALATGRDARDDRLVAGNPTQGKFPGNLRAKLPGPEGVTFISLL